MFSHKYKFFIIRETKNFWFFNKKENIDKYVEE